MQWLNFGSYTKNICNILILSYEASNLEKLIKFMPTHGLANCFKLLFGLQMDY